jgi:hypothetical protein
VPARDGKRKLDGLELLGPDDLRHVSEPALEERGDLRAGAERRVMVEVDVEQDRDLRSQGCD